MFFFGTPYRYQSNSDDFDYLPSTTVCPHLCVLQFQYFLSLFFYEHHDTTRVSFCIFIFSSTRVHHFIVTTEFTAYQLTFYVIQPCLCKTYYTCISFVCSKCINSLCFLFQLANPVMVQVLIFRTLL